MSKGALETSDEEGYGEGVFAVLADTEGVVGYEADEVATYLTSVLKYLEGDEDADMNEFHRGGYPFPGLSTTVATMDYVPLGTVYDEGAQYMEDEFRDTKYSDRIRVVPYSFKPEPTV